MRFETIGRIVMDLLDQLLGTSQNRRLDDARINGLAQRRVAHNIWKNAAAIILGCCREIELGDNAVAAATLDAVMKRTQGLIPCRSGIPDVVSLIVQHHDAVMGS